MEFSISGNALKTFARSIICLARVGNELVVQASPTQVRFIGFSVPRSSSFDDWMVIGEELAI